VQDLLTRPAKKREMRQSVITPQTQEPVQGPIEQSIHRPSKSVIHTNGGSSNGASPNGATPHVKNEPKSERQEVLYPYDGWRYTETTTAEGVVVSNRIGLTLYELLHPQEGYVIVQRTPHEENIGYGRSAMGTHLSDDPEAFVFAELRTDLNLPDIAPIVPDISVYFGIPEKKDWSTFDCQKEGIFPTVVFEITSPSTRGNDFDEKYDYYCQAEIPFYVILDIEYDKDNQAISYHLHVFQLVNGEYVAMPPNHEGRYWISPLALWLGMDDEGILCYDEQGNLLLNHTELAHALDEAERAHNAAIERADEQEKIAHVRLNKKALPSKRRPVRLNKKALLNRRYKPSLRLRQKSQSCLQRWLNFKRKNQNE